MNIKQRGFTLLLAALISAIVLSLASAIFSIAKKQVTLASLSQQSQYAFYAADTGAECALYWDVRDSYFATLTPVGVTPVCDTATLFPGGPPHYPTPATYSSPSSGPEYTTTFALQLQNGNCANVTVIKCLGTLLDNGICCPNGASGGSCTGSTPLTTVSSQIRSNGFNASCSGASSSQSVLERSAQLNY